ncbi:hypothetical protein [Mesorhizobium sp. M1B.F.Ca.ET.045.04.1.1]|uniref:hypothetical protein n=1 Tax=Mesorhizobium sp. M1B.F.Ca.ET.045.04.1.1 TaxID=2493673 RepID=UPI000F760344|nr:hypothetical protein [Mesorhizobium sp. M1B.F.Ca.ET.045.04.1.1]AZO29341.1 hypothetical protein EJ071_19440 [Mesorhizobium sp. M1B.F.Ca.ET.045.04.1.1]
MIGKFVKSVAVGDKPAFSGVILSVHPGSIPAWIVEDLQDGSKWHRERSELTIMKAKPPATAQEIMGFLSRLRLPLSTEVKLQLAIAEEFNAAGVNYEREVQLSPEDRPDFMIGDVAIEVKIKGSKRAIFHQVERYAQHAKVRELILISNVAMGFPPEINGKPVYFHNLAKAWL